MNTTATDCVIKTECDVLKMAPHVPKSEILLSKHEVAALLRVSSRTIDRLTAKGKILYARIGGQVRFRLNWVRDYVDRSCEIHDPQAMLEKVKGRLL